MLYDFGGGTSNDILEYFFVPNEAIRYDKVEFTSSSDAVGPVGGKRMRSESSGSDEDEKSLLAMKQRAMREIVRSVEAVTSRLVLRKNPLHLDVGGTFTIHTDENRCITHFETCVEYN